MQWGPSTDIILRQKTDKTEENLVKGKKYKIFYQRN